MEPPLEPPGDDAAPTDETIFTAAAQLDDPQQRAALVRAACAGDLVRMDRIQRLLHARHAAIVVADQPALGPLKARPVQDPKADST